ncbi:CPBP family intramembrane glutamic endopeptidase [Hydrococcus rivularis]|uniref:CPBP family intramembrane glutamic endopeptidase n=1 Tax=Hydrococcus rivularis TaxID=1616834 RepID=UPI00158818F8|nr:type II CAAX endopeptidase family protein [Hydrococcus rivularis]
MTFNLTRIISYPAPARLGIFILALLSIWLPLAIPVYSLLKSDPNLATILTMGLMFIAFIILLRFWSQKVYLDSHWLKRYGLVGTRQNGVDLLNGLSIGLLSVLGLFALEAILGWVIIKTPSIFLLRIVGEGLLSALGIGLAEELLFRGWFLNELERDYSPNTVLWANALIFALLHFLKPIEEILRTFPTFPALILLGLTLVWAKRSSSQRLGICIGIHAGLVWGYYILNVGQLLQYTGKVSPWITGIDNNPIAGAMGIIFLGILAVWMRKRARISGKIKPSVDT